MGTAFGFSQFPYFCILTEIMGPNYMCPYIL